MSELFKNGRSSAEVEVHQRYNAKLSLKVRTYRHYRNASAEIFRHNPYFIRRLHRPERNDQHHGVIGHSLVNQYLKQRHFTKLKAGQASDTAAGLAEAIADAS